MNIIDFYKTLSSILCDRREEFLSSEDARMKLDELLSLAEESNLNVNVSLNILEMSNLIRLDDERPYDSIKYDDDYWM